jgi:hypothetical protein
MYIFGRPRQLPNHFAGIFMARRFISSLYCLLWQSSVLILSADKSAINMGPA